MVVVFMILLYLTVRNWRYILQKTVLYYLTLLLSVLELRCVLLLMYRKTDLQARFFSGFMNEVLSVLE